MLDGVYEEKQNTFLKYNFHGIEKPKSTLNSGSVNHGAYSLLFTYILSSFPLYSFYSFLFLYYLHSLCYINSFNCLYSFTLSQQLPSLQLLPCLPFLQLPPSSHRLPALDALPRQHQPTWPWHRRHRQAARRQTSITGDFPPAPSWLLAPAHMSGKTRFGHPPPP